MDASNAKQDQQIGLLVLERTLSAAQCLPPREFNDAAVFATYLQNESTVIIDGFEQRMQRPNDDEVQRDLPHKKPKKQELTPEQKAESKLLAGERIVVEHRIAGLKRYRIYRIACECMILIYTIKCYASAPDFGISG